MRSAKPEDAGAIHAIACRSALALWRGGTPWDNPVHWRRALVEGATDTYQPFVAEKDGVVAAYAAVRMLGRPRARHLGQLDLLLPPDDPETSAALLQHVCEQADRWLGLNRLELIAQDLEPWRTMLAVSGFEVEVREDCSGWAGGRVPLTQYGRLRPGFMPPTAPPRPIPFREEGEAAQIRVRPTRPEDGEEIAPIFEQESVMWGTLQSPAASGRGWTRKLERNADTGVFSLVAEVDGRVVGTLGLHPLPPPRWRCWGLGMGVTAEWQGRGVGTALMAAAVQLADQWLGVNRLQLEVFTDNTRAVGLYRKLGFETEGVRRASAWRDGAYADSFCMARIWDRG